MSRKKDIDALDIEILNILQRDASITNRDLAKRIDLTPGPTLVRVRNLQKKGYLEPQSYQKINWKKLGYDYWTIVRASVPKKKKLKFTNTLKNTEGIMTVLEISRETKVEANVIYFSIVGVFKDEDDFTEKWSDILSSCSHPVDFQVWEWKSSAFENNPINVSL